MARPRKDVIALTVETPRALKEGLDRAAAKAGVSLTVYLLSAAARHAKLPYTPGRRGRPPGDKNNSPGISA